MASADKPSALRLNVDASSRRHRSAAALTRCLRTPVRTPLASQIRTSIETALFTRTQQRVVGVADCCGFNAAGRVGTVPGSPTAPRRSLSNRYRSLAGRRCLSLRSDDLSQCPRSHGSTSRPRGRVPRARRAAVPGVRGAGQDRVPGVPGARRDLGDRAGGEAVVVRPGAARSHAATDSPAKLALSVSMWSVSPDSERV